MRIAIEGCCHGELDKIYASIEYIQKHQNIKIDLLLICGDFQSIRNNTDLSAMACPDKYKQIGTFYKFYNSTKKPIVPTVFIGGNHEASNYLWELFHGGWVCPDVYFLGFAGCIRFNGLRISGLSGIFKASDYMKGHYEKEPYSASDCRSIYHVRQFDVFRVAQLSGSIDVFLSHDWPRGIASHGDTRGLIARKRFLEQEIYTNTLGSEPGEFLLHRLQPSYWFSAHLHVKFAAVVNHNGQSNESVHQNDDEIPIDDSDGSETDVKATGPSVAKTTKFLALDKCLPGRDFLQVIEVPDIEGQHCGFEYDSEWLAIVRATYSLFSNSVHQTPLPSDEQIQHQIQVEKKWVAENIVEKRPDALKIPDNFVCTAPPYDHTADGATHANRHQAGIYENPQTKAFCEMLGLKNHINALQNSSNSAYHGASPVMNPEELIIDDDE